MLPLAGILLGLAVLLVQSRGLIGYRGSDFIIFHEAVRRTLTDPATLYRDADGAALSLQGFLYAPPSIALLLPFGIGDQARGFLLLSWSALAAAMLAIGLWLRALGREKVIRPGFLVTPMLILLAAATGPVASCRMGQVDTLILLIIVAGAVLARRGHPVIGGAVLAFGAWVKIYPVLILLPLLFDRRLRRPVSIGFAGGALAILLLAALIFPMSVWVTYAHMLPRMAERTIINIYNQSITADMLRLSLPHSLALETYAAVPVPAPLRLGIAAAGLALIAAMQWRVARTGASPLIVLAVAMAVISLVAPLGWGHSYAYVLPLLVMVAAQAIARRAAIWLAAIALAWAALLIPAYHRFAMAEAAPWLWTLVYSRYAIATLVLLGAAWHFATRATVRARA
jgi:alpha-1,2-mannosyltransferase